MADYNVMDKATVGQVKTGFERAKADYERKIGVVAADTAKAFKSAKTEGNTVNFYTSADQSGAAAFSFDFPAEQFLDQAKTAFVPEFTFSAENYPGATDPNMNGKPVMVLAVKGKDGENETVTYSFVDMTKLVDTYTAKAGDGTATVIVDGYEISVNVNVSAEAGNILQKKADGLYVAAPDTSDKADKVKGATAGNLATLDASGNIVDSGVSAAKVLTEEDVATDEEFNAMLDELFPAE